VYQTSDDSIHASGRLLFDDIFVNTIKFYCSPSWKSTSLYKSIQYTVQCTPPPSIPYPLSPLIQSNVTVWKRIWCVRWRCSHWPTTFPEIFVPACHRSWRCIYLGHTDIWHSGLNIFDSLGATTISVISILLPSSEYVCVLCYISLNLDIQNCTLLIRWVSPWWFLIACLLANILVGYSSLLLYCSYCLWLIEIVLSID